MKRARSPHPEDIRIDEALRRGETLRFDGRMFEEAHRPRGTGPTYNAIAVLRRARAGRAMISTTAGEGVYFEILAKKAPTRSVAP